MSQHASRTQVSPERSQEEIKRTLRRYGASEFVQGETDERVSIGFRFGGLAFRMDVELPDKSEFSETPTGRGRRGDAAHREWEQAIRQRWRALLLAIRAKLEAIETGISTVEWEFMPFAVMADGQRIGDVMAPQLEAAKTSGRPLRFDRMLPAEA